MQTNVHLLLRAYPVAAGDVLLLERRDHTHDAIDHVEYFRCGVFPCCILSDHLETQIRLPRVLLVVVKIAFQEDHPRLQVADYCGLSYLDNQFSKQLFVATSFLAGTTSTVKSLHPTIFLFNGFIAQYQRWVHLQNYDLLEWAVAQEDGTFS